MNVSRSVPLVLGLLSLAGCDFQFPISSGCPDKGYTTTVHLLWSVRIDGSQPHREPADSTALIAGLGAVLSSPLRLYYYGGPSGRSYAVVNLLTGEDRLLVTRERAVAFQFSMDQNRILYILQREEYEELRILNNDGTGERTVLRDSAWIGPAKWIQNDRTIAYGRNPYSGKPGSPGIWFLDLATLEAKLVWEGEGGLVTPDGFAVLYQEGNDIMSWSLVDSVKTKIGEGELLAISPEGEHVLFARGESSLQKEAWVMRRDGSGKVRLFGSIQDTQRPVFSPTGRKVAISTTEGIWIADVDGTKLQKVAAAEHHEGSATSNRMTLLPITPIFSSDESRVYYRLQQTETTCS